MFLDFDICNTHNNSSPEGPDIQSTDLYTHFTSNINNGPVDKLVAHNIDKTYYGIDQYSQTKYKCGLSIISMNINSLRKHIDELNVLVESIINKPDVLIISEIRNNVDDILMKNFGEHYNFHIKYPINNKCGGIVILIKKSISYRFINNLESDNNAEIDTVIVEVNTTKSESLFILGIYKHPSCNIKTFTNYLIKQLSRIHTSKNIILAGDMNIDLVKYNSNVHIKNYVDKLKSLGVYQVITAPTRITKTTKTLIDHIYLRFNKEIRFESGIFLTAISDHLGTFIKINLKPKINYHGRKTIRIFNDKNREKFKYSLIDLEQQTMLNNNLDSNEKWNSFVEIIKGKYESAFPEKLISRKKFKDKPWINNSIKKASKIKENLYKKWKQNRNDINYMRYVNYKNKFNAMIRNSKQLFYNKLFENDANSKKVWDEVNSIIKNKSKENKIAKIEDNGISYESNKDISNLLNKYFTTIGEILNANIISGNNDFRKYMPPKLDNSIRLTKISVQEVEKIINSMANKNSSGIDMISQKLLKFVGKEVCPVLTKLINLSILEQKYPECLKTAKVIPIHKGGSKSDCNNYRPISLLSSFNKIFETKICNDISKFVDKNNILFINQFGFRKYHNTIDALIKVHDHITEEKRNKRKIIGIFLDFRKAFDSINTEILISKLEYYGISGPYNKLLNSYLTDRKTRTYTNDAISEPMVIKFGVPQGSVLGPILFSLYINDIKNMAENFNINLFADDTSLFCSGETYNQVETKCKQALKECSKWLISNKLTLNVTKSNWIDFSKPTKDGKNITLDIDGKILKEVEYTKYLGIIIQKDLKWDVHVSSLINKLNSHIPLYYQIRNTLSNKQKIMIYKALALSKLIYGIELYSKVSKQWLKQLQKTQNRLLKILLKEPILLSTNLLHKKYDILKIEDLANLRKLLIGHRVMHSANFNVAYENMKPIRMNQARNLRNNLNFIVDLNYYAHKNKVIENACVLWNDLNVNEKRITDRNKFKTTYQKKTLNSY